MLKSGDQVQRLFQCPLNLLHRLFEAGVVPPLTWMISPHCAPPCRLEAAGALWILSSRAHEIGRAVGHLALASGIEPLLVRALRDVPPSGLKVT